MRVEDFIYGKSENYSYIERNDFCVVGIGGAGTNTINRIYNLARNKFYTISINTDISHLSNINADKKILLNLPKGLGTGGDPNLGYKAAFSARDEILNVLKGFKVIFIVSGFGGGTGTGATQVITKIALDTGALVINIVTLPFKAEGSRYKKAVEGIKELTKVAKTLILLDNNKLLENSPRYLPIERAFKVMDQLIFMIIYSFHEMIYSKSNLHISYSEVKNFFSQGKLSTIFYNEGSIDNIDYIIKNIVDTSLADINISSSTRAIVFITTGEELDLDILMRKIIGGISSQLAYNENITPGYVVDRSLGNNVRILVLVTNVMIPIIEEKSVIIEQKNNFSKNQNFYL
ncbi:MAG: cell division protein FtsZ [Thermoplasmata archaeon]|nr:cell division protein FtsZ [Thermoplasmata archaeon]